MARQTLMSYGIEWRCQLTPGCGSGSQRLGCGLDTFNVPRKLLMLQPDLRFGAVTTQREGGLDRKQCLHPGGKAGKRFSIVRHMACIRRTVQNNGFD